MTTRFVKKCVALQFSSRVKEILEVSLHDQGKKNRPIRWAAVRGLRVGDERATAERFRTSCHSSNCLKLCHSCKWDLALPMSALNWFGMILGWATQNVIKSATFFQMAKDSTYPCYWLSPLIYQINLIKILQISKEFKHFNTITKLYSRLLIV